MDWVLTCITVGTVALLGAISPGPDFAMVVKNAVLSSKRAGIATALGVACGCLVHVTYSIIGIGALVAESIVAFTVVKWLGALYLLYLGIRMIFSKKSTSALPEQAASLGSRVERSFFAVFKEGFLTNVLNPKATLFFLAIFTQVIHLGTPVLLKVAYGIEIASLIGLWFIALTFLLNLHHFKAVFAKSIHRLEQTMGVLLVGLACSVAFERR